MRKLLLCSLVLAAGIARGADDDRIFRVRLVEDAGTLDWNNGEVNPDIVYQMMEGLTKAGHDGEVQAGVAKRWLGEDGAKKFTFILDENSQWSDGTRVCAADFKYSWDRLKSPAFASPYAHFANPIHEVKAESCEKLVVTLEHSTPQFPALVSHLVFFPVQQKQLEKAPAAFTNGTGLITNGPYKFESWKRGQKLVLTQNPLYRPAFAKQAPQKLEFLFVPEDTTALALFESGKIDWFRDIPPLLRRDKVLKQGRFFTVPTLISYYFGLNSNAAPELDDAQLRQALSAALDRKELPKVLGQEVAPSETWLPALFSHKVPHTPKGKEKSDLLANARAQLLALTKSGKLKLRLRVYGKSIHRELAEWVQGQWRKNLGVHIPIEVQEAKVYWAGLKREPAAIFLGGITAPYAHPTAYLQEFLSSSTANWTNWKDGRYDGAVKANRYDEAEQILQDGGFIIPLYNRSTAILIRYEWEGFSMNPMGVTYLREMRRP